MLYLINPGLLAALDNFLGDQQIVGAEHIIGGLNVGVKQIKVPDVIIFVLHVQMFGLVRRLLR